MATIVIDPGHGGSDPGAVSGGVRESHMAMEMALRVGHYIRRLSEQHLKTVYTREDDTSININARAHAARQTKDSVLFLSLHHNAATSASARGAMALISQTGAFKDRSGRVAVEMLSRLAASGLPNRGVFPDRPPYIRFNQLGVLAGTCWNMPAVLLEVGFLTNQKDRAMIADRHSREVLAICIASGAMAGLGYAPQMQLLS